jgi:hypothetical protein
MSGRLYGGLPGHHPGFGNFCAPEKSGPMSHGASFIGDRYLTARLVYNIVVIDPIPSRMRYNSMIGLGKQGYAMGDAH